MKTKPQHGARSVFVKSCADKINITDAIERYTSNANAQRIGITFIGPEVDFEKLKSLPTKHHLQIRYCSSIGLLLRSGLYQESSVFVFASPSPVAKQTNIEQILSARTDSKIKVLLLTEGSSSDWSLAIEEIVEEMEFSFAKDSIANDVFNRSPKLSAKERDKNEAMNVLPSAGTGSASSEDTLSEEEFKELISYKLNQHLQSSPENILSKAIDIIKN
jgi:hypothetical protein